MKNEQEQNRAREIVKAVVTFANLKTIKSTQQVEGLFNKFAGERFQTLPPDEKHIQAFRKDQALLREHLNLIADGSDASKIKLYKELPEFINDKVHAKVSFERGKIQYDYTVDGVQAALGLGLAFMLGSRYNVGHLKQCQNPDCKKFLPNFDLRARPRKTCNDKCKQKADAYQKRLRRSQ